MGRRYNTVSLLTDYGTKDEFVGVLKSVLRDLAPHAVAIDLTNEIEPHDIRGASLTLARCIQYVAPGVVLAVVDPGVGTTRRAIAVEIADGAVVLVGPDNGLLAPAVAMAGGPGRAVELTNVEFHLAAAGPTFAGRDVFAPVAAHLCNGVDLAEVGDPIDAAGVLPGVVPLSRIDGDQVVTEILWVDRFGNAQLNVGPDDIAPLGERVQLRAHGVVRSASRAATYGLIATGQFGIVVDSYGLVSVCLDRQSAAAELGLSAGDSVVLGPPVDTGQGETTPVTLRR